MTARSPRPRQPKPLRWLIALTLSACFTFPSALRADDDTRIDELLFFEAMTLLGRNMVDPRPSRDVVHSMLDAYLKATDPYAEFLRPDERKAYEEAQRFDYSGVGMQVIRHDDGRFICFPYPGSPAARAGVRMGDVLDSVDGQPVRDIGTRVLVSRVRGETGTIVTLGVVRDDQPPTAIKVERQAVFEQTVLESRVGDFDAIRILAFTPATPEQLRGLLRQRQITGAASVLIDLRSNGGGDLIAAVACAQMFLPPGKTIASLARQRDEQPFTSTGDEDRFDMKLVLLQDRNTASAAELFIAALVENDRAESLGEATYGKDKVQDILPLNDGSAMYMTVARWRTPRKTDIDRKGLSPTLRGRMDTRLGERFPRKPQPLTKGERVYVTEKIENSPISGGWIVLYEGTLTHDLADAMKGSGKALVQLHKRFAIRYRLNVPAGVDPTDWWCVPPKRWCYSQVKFGNWESPYKEGQTYTFDVAAVHRAEQGLLALGHHILEVKEEEPGANESSAGAALAAASSTDGLLNVAVRRGMGLRTAGLRVKELRAAIEKARDMAVEGSAKGDDLRRQHELALKAELEFTEGSLLPWLKREYRQTIAGLATVEAEARAAAIKRVGDALKKAGKLEDAGVLTSVIAGHLRAAGADDQRWADDLARYDPSAR